MSEDQGSFASTTVPVSPQDRAWIDEAKAQFYKGNYGLAERYFRQVVEDQHTNLEAWLGLGATYDHLKRFEDAERAYSVVMKHGGRTPTLLNNLGYHHMMKGEWDKAEKYYLEAQAMDPSNAVIHNNLKMLAHLRAGGGVAR